MLHLFQSQHLFYTNLIVPHFTFHLWHPHSASDVQCWAVIPYLVSFAPICVDVLWTHLASTLSSWNCFVSSSLDVASGAHGFLCLHYSQTIKLATPVRSHFSSSC